MLSANNIPFNTRYKNSVINENMIDRIVEVNYKKIQENVLVDCKKRSTEVLYLINKNTLSIFS